jgi:hypothetical protein
VSTIQSGLIAKGYDVLNKQYFVRKLDTVNNPDGSDIFNNQAIAVQKGGCFVSYIGSKNKDNTKSLKVIIDTHEFIIIPFIKIGIQDKMTSLNNFINDIKAIVYHTTFSVGKCNLVEARPNKLPSTSSKSVYYGYIVVSFDNVYQPD